MKTICSKCHLSKDTESFYIKSNGKCNAFCKDCVYAIQKHRWKDRKKKAVTIMGGCCCLCGYNKNYAALEFHHLDKNLKEFDWRLLRQCKWSTVINELNKCILVCSNCHQEIHHPDLCFVENNEEELKDNVNLNIERFTTLTSTGTCPKCQSLTYGTKYCSVKCASYSHRKVIRPSKEELELMIGIMSWTDIGK